MSQGVIEQSGAGENWGWVERIDAALNPILVRDLRVWLRSRRFLLVLGIAAVLTQVVTLTMISAAAGDPMAGRTLFYALVGGLASLMTGVVPWMMQGGFMEELRSRSLELVLISRLTPGQLVRGKVASTVVASFLFFSVAGPSLVIAYMIGGIDPVAALACAAALIVLSLLSAVVTILLGAVFSSRSSRLIQLVPITSGVVSTSSIVAIADPYEMGHVLGRPGTVQAFAGALGVLLVFVFFLYAVATARLSFPADNRDLGPRLTLSFLVSALFLVAVGVPLAVNSRAGYDVFPDNPIRSAATGAILTFTLLSFLLMNTPESPSTRVRNQWPGSWLFSLLYYPGTGRLCAYLASHILALVLGSVLLDRVFHPEGVDPSPTLVVAVIAMGLWATTVLAGAQLLQHMLRRFNLWRFGKEPRPLSVVEVALLWTLAGLVLAPAAAIVELDPISLLLSPATALLYLLAGLNMLGLESESADPGAAAGVAWILGLIAVPCILFWVHQIRKAAMETRILCRDRKQPPARPFEGGEDGNAEQA